MFRGRRGFGSACDSGGRGFSRIHGRTSAARSRWPGRRWGSWRARDFTRASGGAGGLRPRAEIRCQAFDFSGLKSGGRTRARTWDPLIKSQLLYQLSYAPGKARGPLFKTRRSCSRAAAACPATRALQVEACALWSATVLGAAIFVADQSEHGGTHAGVSTDWRRARRAGAADRRGLRAGQAQGHDRGRRGRVPVLPADGAGQAARRIRQGRRRGRTDRLQGRPPGAAGRDRRLGRRGLGLLRPLRQPRRQGTAAYVLRGL